MIAPFVFWLSVLFVVYAYVGYPLALKVLSRIRSRPVRKGDIIPTVSFVITAYNEERRIRDKIENTLKLVYPQEKLEIIVASDGSSDRTDEIVMSFESRGVRLVRATRRGGKEATQQMAVAASRGEILVFSDVATAVAADAVARIVRNFHDPTVGCVSSVDRFIDAEGRVSGEGAYVRYEMFLRGLETRVGSLVGLSGSFFAARRSVCREWAADLQSDFNTLLNAVKAGLRGVSDPEAVGYYRNLTDERKEFDRKVRTVQRGIAVFMRGRALLNPLRYGLFSWQLLSHKLCRWLVPFAMIAALVSNACLALESASYLALLCLQVAFYVVALAGLWLGSFPGSRLIKLPSFLFLVNLSILKAWYRYLKGERLVKWDPSMRPV